MIPTAVRERLGLSSDGERPIDIRVRRMDFDFPDDTPEFWFDGDPFLTLFYTAFSATLPDGEKMFIRSVQNYRDRIQDPGLRAEVQAFIGQEAQHAKGHEALNRFMTKRGYSVDVIERRARAIMAWSQEHMSRAQQLANTVCAEHFTALMADYYLSKVPEDLELVDERVRLIWSWHILEEAEHKAVAFDVYQQVVDDTALLRRTMAVTTVLFAVTSGIGALRLLSESGRLRDPRLWTRTLRRFVSPRGFVPLMWRDYLDFYRSDYHPWQHDNREAIAAFRAKYLEEPARAEAA